MNVALRLGPRSVSTSMFLAALVLLGGPLPGEETEANEEIEANEENEEKDRSRNGPDLQAVGRPKPIKGFSSFFEFTYLESKEKRRSKEKRAFLKLPEKFSLYRDRRAKLEELEPGDKVFILGRPIARDVPQRDRKGKPTGRRSKDRQIQNATILVTGEAPEVNVEYPDRRDRGLEWCESEVRLVKGGLWVKYDGHDHRVTIDRNALIVKREVADREAFEKARTVHVVGEKTSDRPDTGEKADRATPCFRVQRVVVIDRSLPAGYERVAFP